MMSIVYNFLIVNIEKGSFPNLVIEFNFEINFLKIIIYCPIIISVSISFHLIDLLE